MNSLLPNRGQAIELLRENHCSPEVISHCVAVADLALETASRLSARGLKVDIEIVETGALLHDLGRSRNHSVEHGLIGAQIGQTIGLPESIVNIIKRHVGGGITVEEAKRFGWPKDIYIPQTLEEKIVCYSDKLIDHSKRVPIELEIERLQRENKVEAAERVRKLGEELTNLMGN